MRHLKHRHSLGRKKEHRAALMANLAAALFRHGRIQTTLAKAKALRPFAEKIVTLAKQAQTAKPERALALRRQAISKVRDIDAIATLFNERAAEFTDRPGGYTRIYKLGTRIGDAAEMAVIQLIPGEDSGYDKKSASKSKAAEPAASSGEVSETATEEESAVAEATEEVVAEADSSTESTESEEVVVEEATAEEAHPEEEKKD